MKRLQCLAAVLLLGGCAHGTVPQKTSAEAPIMPPAGMIKLLDTPEVATYFDIRSVEVYQGNPHLRQFYLINNYLGPVAPSGKPREIRSSQAMEVVNCARDEMARFGRVYFSQPFALGDEVARKGDIAQWTPLERQSMNGTLRNLVCSIDAAHLRPGNPG